MKSNNSRAISLTGQISKLSSVPMMLSTSGVAEVQRPLATVVIGGLITSTLLTLLVLQRRQSQFAPSEARSFQKSA
ncbi:MAG: efflux RND transporter permease subunit [Acidobacteria bacterium]|nr:efflux RND transporter permease subunit [Acidobacteriota bacterium]